MQEVGFVANPLLASLPEAGRPGSKVAGLRPQGGRLQKLYGQSKSEQTMKKQKTDKALTTGLLKAPSDYYTVRMMFNMTIEEKRLFEDQMAACGYTSPQRFFREVLLRRKRVKAEKSAVPPTIKEMNPQDVKLLIQELKRIGNNVNQAVRNLNTRMEWMQYNSRAEEDWGTLERDVNSMCQFTIRIDKTCTLFGLYLEDNAL